MPIYTLTTTLWAESDADAKASLQAIKHALKEVEKELDLAVMPIDTELALITPIVEVSHVTSV